ncbi:MAG: carbohydrate-binding protein SusD [Muricauda sp.]|nr:RagB/SusD family nutrient uptake outer membrane protein [Allomuricauda sp.]MAU26870.1 carbohydrate-binding protein SusD [Allomuricauda sp.]MBC31088.1 carbohydrate-binding protein SusD [Allomuricauda sp.]|tara:strand:+ start:322 stop:1626 length:1305 start_codon:yes stop_codon:yes gene_type:complete
MKDIKNLIVLGILIVFASSCDKVYLDPNSTLEPDVVNNTDNLVALINGVQQRWSTDRAGIIYTSTHLTGLNTGELRLLNPGNLGENEVLLGGDDINGGNEILNNIWTNAMLCRKEATTVITSADNAADATTANSLKAYGLFYRALVHGTLIQFFESIPLEIIEDAPFVDRSAVLQSAIADLTEAKGYIQSGLSSEITSKVFSSVDLGNSVDALLARFNLMAGNYSEAIAAANNVDLAAQSTWEYDASVPNPLAFWFGSQNVTQARDANFALPASLAPDPNDERVPFYVTQPDPVNDPANYQLIGFWSDNLDEIPVYLPGEMLLIKAEAYARSNDLTNAVAELDGVLTKTAAEDAFGVGANLPAYSGPVEQQAILDEIYRNRRIELYLTGLGLEDSRRFDRPGPSDADPERNRNFYPYPNAERDNNDNTPANPSS